MKLIDKWNYGIVRKWNRLDRQALEPSKLNSRANNAFNRVMEVFKSTLISDTVDLTYGFCQAKLMIANPNGSVQLDCRYELKKMLLGRNYDLCIASYAPGPQSTEKAIGWGDFNIFIKYKGHMKNKSLYFYSNIKHEYAKRIIGFLNHDLIKERILKLDLMDIRVAYSEKENRFQIIINILKGSATWCLIPPVFQYIDISEEETTCIIELLQLIQHQLQGSFKLVNASNN